MRDRKTQFGARLGGAAAFAFVGLAGCVGGEGGAGAGDEAGGVESGEGSPDAELHFESDRALLFEEAGERAELEAAVYREGTRDLDAAIRFESSDPSAVSVDDDGVVTAQTDLGSAMITAKTAGAPEAVATVVVADLHPRTLRLSSEEIVAIDRENARATIRIAEGAEEPSQGDILLSGERDGLFARVDEVWRDADGAYEIRYATDVALVEAFENLDLRARLPAEMPAAEELAAEIGDFRCVDESDALVEFSRPEIEPHFDPELHFDYAIESGRVSTIELSASAELGADGHAGEVELQGKFGGAFRCDVELPELEIPPVSLVGPALELGGAIAPRVGFRGRAEFEIPAVTYAGPEFAVKIDGEMGIAADGDGVSTIRDVETVRDEFSPGQWDQGPLPDSGFAFEAVPFVAADWRVSPGFFGGLFSLDIDLVTAEAAAGLDLELAPPFDPYAPGYRGPEWALFFEGEVSLHPLLSTVSSAVEFFRDRLGADVSADSIRAIDPALWEEERDLAGAPRFEVAPDRGQIGIDDEVAIRTDSLGGYEGAVEYLLHPCGVGEGEILAEEPAGAPAQFSPRGESDRGEHGLSALLWDGVFGPAGLPYAPEHPGTLEVGEDAGEACAETAAAR